MENIILTNENFIEQIVKYGYFNEQIPPCFNSKKLLKNIPEIIKTISINDIKHTDGTSPITLSIYKNDISKRIFSLPNPKTFLEMVKYMSINWSEVKKHAESDNSHSPIIYLHKYFDTHVSESLNDEAVRSALGDKSSFIPNLKDNIILSLGYKYLLNIDIVNFYNTIYTHAITWAICGKEKAKKTYLNQVERTDEYIFADNLDTLIRCQKNKETNGIITGPFTSRIVSEIIMARIDKILTEKGYVFTRYVDDFKLYFRTEIEAITSVPIIEKIVNEYGLNLNTSKTKITKYPFNTISKISATYIKAFKDDGVFGVLNSAAILFNNNEKGAYKYAMKVIEDKLFAHVTLEAIQKFQEILSMLINIMLLRPNLGKSIVEYLKLNKNLIIKDQLAQSINKELESILDNELQEEILWFVYASRELGLAISCKNLINILTYGDDFSIIIILDIYNDNRNHYNKDEIITIDKEIKKLASSLKGENMNGSRWLLLYEITVHEFMSDNIIPKPTFNSFFKYLKQKNISFYENITQAEDITL